MSDLETQFQQLAAEYAEKVRRQALAQVGGVLYRWQCNACNAIRQAPCGRTCLPADYYDPRDARETAAVLDFEGGFDE